VAEENAPAATENIKKKALMRLAIAGGITLVALAGLWWLDKSGNEHPPAKPAVPAPIIASPAPIAGPVPPQQAEEAPMAPGASDLPPPQEPPPPPQPGLPAVSAKPMSPPDSRVREERGGQGTEAAQAAGRPILANAEPPAGRGYVVQLGVFTKPGNAQELVDRLRKQGIRAYTETRVHVGPFLNRAEAEKAQAELRRLGISGVVGATR
jgi:DedD protein